MIVGICKLDLHLGGHRSLKEKRKIIRKIKDSVLSRFKVVVSEVGSNDLWQRAELGFAVVGNSQPDINSRMDKVINFVSDTSEGYLIDKRDEFIHF